MDNSKLIKHIVKWLNSYSKNSNTKGFIIGVSGGIDSAVTSTLCCRTNLPTICLEMPIHQSDKELERSKNHILWLKNNYTNVESKYIDLTSSFEEIKSNLCDNSTEINNLALANSRSRLRMLTLYYHAAINNFLVVGTGNKVEDFGVGFYTKYGDGGVDISPIADCTKSQVWEMGEFLEIDHKIISAPPTDGLWVDGRNDEDQLGMTYKELEEAMENPKSENYNKYLKIRENNLHKMKEIPVCKFD